VTGQHTNRHGFGNGWHYRTMPPRQDTWHLSQTQREFPLVWKMRYEPVEILVTPDCSANGRTVALMW